MKNWIRLAVILLSLTSSARATICLNDQNLKVVNDHPVFENYVSVFDKKITSLKIDGLEYIGPVTKQEFREWIIPEEVHGQEVMMTSIGKIILTELPEVRSEKYERAEVLFTRYGAKVKLMNGLQEVSAFLDTCDGNI